MTDPDEQTSTARRALGAWRIGAVSLTRLAESFNTVFRVDAEGGRFALRLGPPIRIHAPGAAEAEARWTADLAARGVCVPTVVRAADGAASTMIDGGRECSLRQWLPGRIVARPLSQADLRDLAVLAARLHEASPTLAERPDGALDARRVALFEIADDLEPVPQPVRKTLLAARDRSQLVVDELWANADVAPRLLHGDLTPTNVLRADAGLLAIDFQDMFWGHVEQDLAHTLYGVSVSGTSEPGSPFATVAAFRRAYETVRPWPARLDGGLLAELVAARRVSMVALAVARGRPDLAEYAERHAAALRT